MTDSKAQTEPDDEKKDGKGRNWRDNIEAVTMAIIMAVMLKYFIIEAYKIPTGSMQPTLMGNKQLAIEDRILVDKLSYHFRDPERFEVVIFKYPLDRSKNFIKRIVGMPGEKLRIDNGDLWTRKSDDEPWKILRKPANVQADMWKPLIGRSARQQGWAANAAARKWQIADKEISARGSGVARYPGKLDSIRDEYKDGYPRKMAAQMVARNGGNNDVGDLRVTGDVTALAGLEQVSVRFVEGDLTYRCIIPGPAADADAKTRIEAQQSDPNGPVSSRITVESDGIDFRLSAGSTVRFDAHNLDDQLRLIVDGELVCELEIGPAIGESHVALEIEGEGCEFKDLQVYRDIHYSTTRVKFDEWDIPEDSYVMLGDNTLDSSDGREWQFSRFELTADQLGEEVDDAKFGGSDKIVLRGSHRGNNENPTQIPGAVPPQTWFRDEFGELYHWERKNGFSPPREFEDAPFVPRHLITGRAVLVFWPIKRNLDVYRLKWIR